MIYITNSYRTEKFVRDISTIEKHLKDLRSEHITTKSQLMSIYKRSTIEEMVSNQGLETSLTPVYIIDINEE